MSLMLEGVGLRVAVLTGQLEHLILGPGVAIRLLMDLGQGGSLLLVANRRLELLEFLVEVGHLLVHQVRLTPDFGLVLREDQGLLGPRARDERYVALQHVGDPLRLVPVEILEHAVDLVQL